MPRDPAFLNVGSVLEEGEMGEQKTFSPKLSSSVWMSREVGRRRRRRIWREGGRESGVLPASSISFSHEPFGTD